MLGLVWCCGVIGLLARKMLSMLCSSLTVYREVMLSYTAPPSRRFAPANPLVPHNQRLWVDGETQSRPSDT